MSDAQRHDLFAVINEESDHLNQLIEEAIEMARLDAGEIELNIEPLPMREVVEAALQAAKNALANRSVELHLPETPAPGADGWRAYQGGSDATSGQRGEIFPLRTPIVISSDVSDRFLVTRVADRGPGIDAFEQALIFDKFYRGRSQRYHVQGTGMGLAICKAIVEAHGGSLGVTSQVGNGSVFHFGLPLAPERARIL